ncbi:MAG: D-Ala-D-Ala carboxypeptidase family metallohydrolase [Desulfamplus sp.]
MRFFQESEFICKCGKCGMGTFKDMNDELLFRLDNARSLVDIPFIINSGFRCEAHNKKVGGVLKSAHLNGAAVDIAINNSIDRFKVFNALRLAGFYRFGLSQNFIHVDVAHTEPMIWIY